MKTSKMQTRKDEIIVKQAKQINCAGVIGLEFTEAYCRDKEKEEE